MGLKERIPHCSTPNLSHFQLVPDRSLSICWFGVNYSSYPGQVLFSSAMIIFCSSQKISLQNRGKDIKSKFFYKTGRKNFFLTKCSEKQGASRCYFTEVRPVTMSLDEVRCYLLHREGNRGLEKSIASRQVRLPYLRKVTTRNGWWSLFRPEFRAISVFFSSSSPRSTPQ